MAVVQGPKSWLALEFKNYLNGHGDEYVAQNPFARGRWLDSEMFFIVSVG